MTDLEKIALLEEIMELDENTLTRDTVLADIDEWDSITKLSLMASVKKQFGKVLSVTEIRGFVTVEDICDYLG